MNNNPKVFISYAHESKEFENEILKFANKLRNKGIDANIDQYEEAPEEGWPRWMENQISLSDYVLVVCTKAYYDKIYNNPKGKGVSWEINIIYTILYSGNTVNKKFIPVFFNQGDEQYILTPIKSFTYYNISKDCDKLCNRLRGEETTKKPPLPHRERKTMFFNSINIDV